MKTGSFFIYQDQFRILLMVSTTAFQIVFTSGALAIGSYFAYHQSEYFMNREAFAEAVKTLPYGKRLPSALYILRPKNEDLPPILAEAVRRAETAAAPDPSWNLLKLHTDQLALTFLSYPEFDADPHPALAESTKINLNSGTVVRTEYRSRANPPILHRKETFLPPSDSRISTFSALTKQEEEAGLYRDPSRIGLRLHWQTLLKRLGLSYYGTTLVRASTSTTQPELAATDIEQTIERHRTAIKRYDLSKPVKIALDRGVILKKHTFFDYGCGHGMDVEALSGLGYEADGWDPSFRPKATKKEADIVNLGYPIGCSRACVRP